MALIIKALVPVTLAVSLMCGMSAAAGENGAFQTSRFSTVGLISAQTAFTGRNPVTVGLLIRMKPGWKTYWRSPGDAGLPPVFDWSGSTNLDGAEVIWPTPKRISVGGYDSFGYAGEVVYPIRIRPAREGEPIALKLDLNYAVCEEICVPEHAELTLTIEPGSPQTTPAASLISTFAAKAPVIQTGDEPPAEAVLWINDAYLEEASGALAIVVHAGGQVPFETPDIFVEGPDNVVFSAPQVMAEGRQATFRVRAGPRTEPEDLLEHRLVLTLADNGHSVERTITLAAEEKAAGTDP